MATKKTNETVNPITEETTVTENPFVDGAISLDDYLQKNRVSDFAKFNSGYNFTTPYKDKDFVKAKDLYNAETPLVFFARGLCVFNSPLGESCVIVTDRFNINVGKPNSEQFKEMANNPKVVEAMNENGIPFTLEERHSKKFNTSYYIPKWL